MAYLIELSPEEEKVVQVRARRLGITPQEYVRRLVGRNLRAAAPSLTLSDAEKHALSLLNTRLSPAFWQRYAELRQKIRTRSLTDAEHVEIRAFAAQDEAWNGERLLLLQQMAQQRKTSLLRFMKHNGIGHHSDADRFTEYQAVSKPI